MSASQPDAPDPRLERLANGELSAQEEQRLMADAAADPELAADIDLYRPYADDALDPLAKAMAPSRARPPHRVRRAGLAGAAAAVALGAIAFGLTSSNPLEPLTDYDLVIEGGAAAALRGAEDPSDLEPWRLDAQVTLLLRPEAAVEGKVELSLFVLEGETWVRRPVGAEVTEQGAFEVEVAVGELFEAPGEHRLACVVARPGAEPSVTEEGPHQVVLMRTVQVVDDP